MTETKKVLTEDGINVLIKRGVITTDPQDADVCCGIERDEDGACQHRPGHPIYVLRYTR